MWKFLSTFFLPHPPSSPQDEVDRTTTGSVERKKEGKKRSRGDPNQASLLRKLATAAEGEFSLSLRSSACLHKLCHGYFFFLQRSERNKCRLSHLSGLGYEKGGERAKIFCGKWHMGERGREKKAF